jgi:hypothetical protein
MAKSLRLVRMTECLELNIVIAVMFKMRITFIFSSMGTEHLFCS